MCVCVCVREIPLLVFSFCVGDQLLDCGCVSSQLEDVRVYLNMLNFPVTCHLHFWQSERCL